MAASSVWRRPTSRASTGCPARASLLRCPWHGWEFDIRTGQSWCDPDSVWVRRFEVTVQPGEQLARGPYVAETFPVSIEDEYLVVEL